MIQGQNNMFWIKSCAKQQVSIDNLSEERASAQIELSSTETSDGGDQKLGNNVRRDSELIAIKVCSQIGRKWIAMFESHVQ